MVEVNVNTLLDMNVFLCHRGIGARKSSKVKCMSAKISMCTYIKHVSILEDMSLSYPRINVHLKLGNLRHVTQCHIVHLLLNSQI